MDVLRLPTPSKLRKRYAGEEIGNYRLIKIAGEGRFADSDYWKAECIVCGEIVTINVTRISSLKKSKNCAVCKKK